MNQFLLTTALVVCALFMSGAPVQGQSYDVVKVNKVQLNGTVRLRVPLTIAGDSYITKGLKLGSVDVRWTPVLYLRADGEKIYFSSSTDPKTSLYASGYVFETAFWAARGTTFPADTEFKKDTVLILPPDYPFPPEFVQIGVAEIQAGVPADTGNLTTEALVGRAKTAALSTKVEYLDQTVESRAVQAANKEVHRILDDPTGGFQKGLKALEKLQEFDGRLARVEANVAKLQQDFANKSYFEISANCAGFYDATCQRWYYDYEGRRYYHHRDCSSRPGWRFFRYYR